MFVEDFGGDFLREVRVREFVGDLGDFGGDAFHFLGEAEALGGEVDEAGEREEEFAEGVGRAGRAFRRRVVAGDFDGLGVEEDFEDFDFGGGQVAGGAEDELQFLRRVELGVAAEVAAEGDEFVFGGGHFFRGVVEAEVFFFLRAQRLGPRGEHDGLAALLVGEVAAESHAVPEFLGDEGKERVEHPQRVAEDEVDDGEFVGAEGGIVAADVRRRNWRCR